MKFTLKAADGQVDYCVGYLENKGFNIQTKETEYYGRQRLEFFIEIENLQELKSVQDICESLLIIDFDDMELWIYNDYME